MRQLRKLRVIGTYQTLSHTSPRITADDLRACFLSPVLATVTDLELQLELSQVAGILELLGPRAAERIWFRMPSDYLSLYVAREPGAAFRTGILNSRTTLPFPGWEVVATRAFLAATRLEITLGDKFNPANATAIGR